MSIFTNNITFAILSSPLDNTWRADLTLRFTEHNSMQINRGNFINYIIFCDTIDEAIDECETDYLLIQTAGNIITNPQFFSDLEKQISQNSDIIIGSVNLSLDYPILDKHCLFINLPLWKQAGSIPYNGNIKSGIEYKISIPSEKSTHPKQIICTGKDKIYLPTECAISGANIISGQLEKFGTLNTLNSVIDSTDMFYLDKSTPYEEIHNETKFDKLFLQKHKDNFIVTCEDEITPPPITSADILISASKGLKPYLLAKYLNVKNVIIFSSNKQELQLQKNIFECANIEIYKNILSTFGHTSSTADDLCVIEPLKNVSVQYYNIEPCGYELETLFKTLPSKGSALFDLNNTFIDPFNYFRKPLYQMQALFAEIYSIIKSRSGPSFIIGDAPGYQCMDTIAINTFKPSIDTVSEYSGFFIPPKSESISEELIPVIEKLIVVPEKISEIDALFNQYGYTCSNNKFIKTVLLENISIEYQYIINNTNWSFRAGDKNKDKRIEFINGKDLETFKKHIAQPVKFNIKTAIKYF